MYFYTFTKHFFLYRKKDKKEPFIPPLIFLRKIEVGDFWLSSLNDKWFDCLTTDLERAFEETFQKMRFYNNSIRSGETLTATPVQVGKRVFPFPLAAQLYPIFQWLMGERKKPKDAEETLLDLEQLVWFNPFVDFTEVLDIEHERWVGMYSGAFYRMAKIALKIEEGTTINATELAFMAHITPMAIVKNIQAEKIPAKKEGNAWVIAASDAKQWLADYCKKNPMKHTDEDDFWKVAGE